VAAGLDRGGVVMVEARFRELFVFPTGAHRIFVRRPAGEGLVEATDRVRALAPAELDVKTWKQIQPMLAQYIDSVAGVVVIIYLIVYLAVGILILNAMLMAVFERIREFGVLKAIGYGPGQVFSMMVAEALVQASVATVLGGLIALPGMVWLQRVGIDVGTLGGLQMAGMTMPAIWKGSYTLATVRVPVVMLFVIAVAAVLWPAAKAAWIQPVEAMRHT
jgi:putative ABC transport system permease protein